MRKLKLNNYIILDCETGGLDKKNNYHASLYPITEIALIAVYADNLEEILRYESMIKGQYIENNEYVGYDLNHTYSKEALLGTGITIEKLEEKGKNYKEVCLELAKIFKELNTGNFWHKPILVGQNIIFDIPFIQQLFQLCNIDLSKLLHGYFDASKKFQLSYIDTMLLSRIKWANEKTKHNLTAIANRFNVELVDAHRAMNDAICTLNIFKSFANLLKISNDSKNVVTDEVKFRDSFQF